MTARSMEGLRTVVTTFGGLGYLLVLAYLTGTLKLPKALAANLAYAGMGMVLGVAAKGSIVPWASRPPAAAAGGSSTTVSIQGAP